MRSRSAILTAISLVAIIGTAFAVVSEPLPFRVYPGQSPGPLPADYRDPGELILARLMYPGGNRGGGRRFGGGGGFGGYGNDSYKQGRSSWTTDYPMGERHLAVALRRLTRAHVRSVEQPVDLDDNDDVFNYPWLYAVEVGAWQLTDSQAKKLREYLDRGGFFMCDDFHGTYQWESFLESMKRVYPDRPIVDIPNSDPIFHTVFDLDRRFQVPGARYLGSGRTWEDDGYEARWRGIYDEKGRLVVAICHNMDLGDAWEWADDPQYDLKFSTLSFHISTNYVVYAMTH